MNHDYKRCTSDATGNSCSGCRTEGGDCTYEVLSICKVCGGMEGSLLPFCPERLLTIEEDRQNYAMYCYGIGPFAEASHRNVTVAYVAIGIYAADRPSLGAVLLFQAIQELLDYIRPELPE